MTTWFRRWGVNPFRRTPLGAMFGGEVPALPVDIFRVLVGLLSGVYFYETFREAADFSAPEGLMNHALVQEVFWFTRVGLFQAGIPLVVLHAVFLFAVAASWAVVLGWRPKFFAAVLFVIAVSSYRWNFLVTYVDDGVMHLMLFWLLLLPIGRTLTLAEWRRDGEKAWRRWLGLRVPGTAAGCFLGNLALIYVVAGLWKWTSPMWRDGTAVAAIAQLPIARPPDGWGPAALPWLRLFDYAALFFEPLFPLMFILRRGHWLKWVLGLAWFGFHVGIVIILPLGLANFACLAGGVMAFREEIMAVLGAGDALVPAGPTAGRMEARRDLCGRCAVGFILLLTLAMVRFAPVVRAVEANRYSAAEMAMDPRGSGGLAVVHEWIYGALWFAGIAQEYQLFNWIDVRNYRARYSIVLHDGRQDKNLAPEDFFPGGTRSALLQCYLFDLCWLRVPPQRNAEVKRCLMEGFARRYCAQRQVADGTVELRAELLRVTGVGAPRIERPMARLFLFHVRAGQVAGLETPAESPAVREAAP